MRNDKPKPSMKSAQEFERGVTSRVAAPLFEMHYKTLEGMARNGEVPATKLGDKWLFRLSVLDEWFDERLKSNVTNHAALTDEERRKAS